MKKILLVLVGIVLFSWLSAAEEKDVNAPGFFGVAVGDSTLSAIDKLTKLGYDMLVLDDNNIVFGDEYSSNKFGENNVLVVGLTTINGRVVGIGLMFESSRLSFSDYRNAVQDYIKQFSDVEVIQKDKTNGSGDGAYTYSMWVVADKYLLNSQEYEKGSTVFSVYDKDIVLEYGMQLI